MPQDALEESLARPFGVAGRSGRLRLVGSFASTVAGAFSSTVPAGAVQALCFVRGAGGPGGQSSQTPGGGGGGAEEFVALSVASGQLITGTVGGSGTASMLQFQGATVCTAAAGSPGTGTTGGAGGVASASGRSGSPGVTANCAGGNSGAFQEPGLGSLGANGGTPPPAYYGGGGGGSSNAATPGQGAVGVVSIVFMGL